MVVRCIKPQMIKDAQDTVDRIMKHYKRGLITEEERYKEVVAVSYTHLDVYKRQHISE